MGAIMSRARKLPDPRSCTSAMRNDAGLRWRLCKRMHAAARSGTRDGPTAPGRPLAVCRSGGRGSVRLGPLRGDADPKKRTQAATPRGRAILVYLNHAEVALLKAQDCGLQESSLPGSCFGGA